MLNPVRAQISEKLRSGVFMTFQKNTTFFLHAIKKLQEAWHKNTSANKEVVYCQKIEIQKRKFPL